MIAYRLNHWLKCEDVLFYNTSGSRERLIRLFYVSLADIYHTLIKKFTEAAFLDIKTDYDNIHIYKKSPPLDTFFTNYYFH